MNTPNDLPVLAFAYPSTWAIWLAEHHATQAGVWLRIAKKGAGEHTVSYAEALEAALCYGWIDGQKEALDEHFWLQRFTPRKIGSRWSQRNRSLAEDLIAQGRMTPAGLREVEGARADGRWDGAYQPQSTATVPDDLQRALERNDQALQFFAGLNKANRYAVLYRIQDAKRPETRARRIEKYVAMLAERRKIHP